MTALPSQSILLDYLEEAKGWGESVDMLGAMYSKRSLRINRRRANKNECDIIEYEKDFG